MVFVLQHYLKHSGIQSINRDKNTGKVFYRFSNDHQFLCLELTKIVVDLSSNVTHG